MAIYRAAQFSTHVVSYLSNDLERKEVTQLVKAGIPLLVDSILVGIQVPGGDEAAFDDFLRTLAYPCVEETRNPVYGLFLR